MERIDRISWLDKLIELLTEHCRRYYWFKEKDDIKIDNDSCNFHLYLKWTRCFPIQPESLIFKHFLFIKYLVENDKIDFDIVKADTTRPIRDNMNKYTLEDYTRYERVLMLLSIQDNPIEFLVSILK